MAEIIYGGCIFCGQMIQIIPGPDESISDFEKMSEMTKARRATENCACIRATVARKRKNAKNRCMENIQDMFSEDENGVKEVLELAAALITNGTIAKVTIKDKDDVTITIADKGDKGIEISKSVKRKESRLS